MLKKLFQTQFLCCKTTYVIYSVPLSNQNKITFGNWSYHKKTQFLFKISIHIYLSSSLETLTFYNSKSNILSLILRFQLINFDLNEFSLIRCRPFNSGAYFLSVYWFHHLWNIVPIDTISYLGRKYVITYLVERALMSGKSSLRLNLRDIADRRVINFVKQNRS